MNQETETTCKTSTPNFTPGPWVTSGEFTLVGQTGRRWEEYVAEVRPTSGEYRGKIADLQSANCISGIDGNECKANAHLIAAAPEMYEALEELLRCVRSFEQEGEAEWMKSEIRDAEKALAKARGEA